MLIPPPHDFIRALFFSTLVSVFFENLPVYSAHVNICAVPHPKVLHRISKKQSGFFISGRTAQSFYKQDQTLMCGFYYAQQKMIGRKEYRLILVQIYFVKGK